MLIAIANICYIGGIVFILAAFSNKINHILFDDPGEVKALVFVLGIIIALFHIYAFVWSASSEKIIKEFQDSKASRLGTCAVIFYMGFSCFFLVAAGLLLWPAIREKLPQI